MGIWFYQIPMTCCIKRLIRVMPIQQQAPRSIGFPPERISFGRLLFRPMAAMAMTIRNLDSSFNGAKRLASAPSMMHTVVKTEARIK